MQDLLHFRIHHPRPQATHRLLLFHHAGGSSLTYLRFAKGLDASIETAAAELPGRGERVDERASSIEDFVQKAASEILALADKPVLILGHSMGALVALEVAAFLEMRGVPICATIFSSSRLPGRHAPLIDSSLHGSREELLEIMKLSGMLAGLENKIAQDYFLPILERDLELVRQYSKISRLKSPVHAWGGDQDPLVAGEHLEEWKICSSSLFKTKLFSGGHFYLLQNLEVLRHLETIR